jgi:predicted HAD superfamily Cof-like phosphohydrolase
MSEGLVRQFHEAFDIPILGQPCVPSLDRVELRRRLVAEEFKEVDAEFERIISRSWRYAHAFDLYVDVARLAKELADLRYVAWGADLEFGIPSHEVDLEVHRSNMSKLGPDGRPVRRHDGKVLKGPNYFEADIVSVLGFIEGSTSP